MIYIYKKMDIGYDRKTGIASMVEYLRETDQMGMATKIRGMTFKKYLKSNSIEIGKIELSRYQTFFEIDQDYKDDFIKNIKKIDFKGNDLILGEPSDFEQKPLKSSRGNRRDGRDRSNTNKRSDSRNSSKKKKKKKSRFK